MLTNSAGYYTNRSLLYLVFILAFSRIMSRLFRVRYLKLLYGTYENAMRLIPFILLMICCNLITACDQRVGFLPLPDSVIEGHIEIRHDLGDPPSVIRGDLFEIGEDLIFELVIDHAENADLENLILDWSVDLGSITDTNERKAYFTSACESFETLPLTIDLDISWARLTSGQKVTNVRISTSLSKRVILQYFIRFNPEIVDGKVWYQYSNQPILDDTSDTIYYQQYPIGIGYFDPVTGGEYIFPMTLSAARYFSDIHQHSNVYTGFPVYDESGRQRISIYNVGADKIWGTEDDLRAEKQLPFPGLYWPDEIELLNGCGQSPNDYNPNTVAYRYFYISDKGVFAVPDFLDQDTCTDECDCRCWIGHYWLEPDGELKQEFLVDSQAEQIAEDLGLEKTFNCNSLWTMKTSDSLFIYEPEMGTNNYLLFRHIGADKLPFSDDDKFYYFSKNDLSPERQLHFWDLGIRTEGGDVASFTQSSNDDQIYQCVNSDDCDAEFHFYHFDENGDSAPQWSEQPAIVPANNAIDFNVSGDWISGYEKLATSPIDGITRPFRLVIKNRDEVMNRGWASAEIADLIYESAIDLYSGSMIWWSDYCRASEIDYRNKLVVYQFYPQECFEDDFNPFFDPGIDLVTTATVVHLGSMISLRYLIIDE